MNLGCGLSFLIVFSQVLPASLICLGRWAVQLCADASVGSVGDGLLGFDCRHVLPLNSQSPMALTL